MRALLYLCATYGVGLGMIPRGEVGLIFASIGASLTLHGHPLIHSATYGAVVIMVVLTTLVTPPLITWRFRKLGTTASVVPRDEPQPAEEVHSV